MIKKLFVSNVFCIFMLAFFCLFSWAEEKERTGQVKKAFGDFDEAFYELRDERDSLKNEIAVLKKRHNSEIEILKAQIMALENQKDSITASLDRSEERVLELEEQNAREKEQSEDTKLESLKISEMINGKDSLIEELKDEKEKLELSRSQTEDALKRSAYRIQKLQEENESLNKQIEVLLEEKNINR
ncbi:MAG TPA: hypothetical protein PLU24_04235 [Candidatus Omnitrophota bacterium]|nr:hypothetical protein [Candidatus Omnitrophota bacterium]